MQVLACSRLQVTMAASPDSAVLEQEETLSQIVLEPVTTLWCMGQRDSVIKNYYSSKILHPNLGIPPI